NRLFQEPVTPRRQRFRFRPPFAVRREGDDRNRAGGDVALEPARELEPAVEPVFGIAQVAMLLLSRRANSSPLSSPCSWMSSRMASGLQSFRTSSASTGEAAL